MDYKSIDNHTLLTLLKADDGFALEEIYHRYSASIYMAAFRKLRSKEAAEELVQNLFISLWARRSDIAIENIESYLFSALRYQVIDFIRRKIIRERAHLQSKDIARTEENSSESKLLLQELSRAIDNTIKRLPQKTQEIFRLSRYEHLSVKEIAQSMNLSEKAVEYHVTQSLKLMRLHLKEFMLPQ